MRTDTLDDVVESVREQLATLPREPGRLPLSRRGDEVLYVGKAKSLRARVRSYFNRGDGRARDRADGRADQPRSRSIVTSSEAEALHLEQNLVKRHRPPFNVRLRDDKSFPYIAVTVADEYPRVMFTRERHRRGTVYFGPYANAKKVRETLDVLNRVFQFRPCEGPKPGRHSGIPCLDFHIERCTAPCIARDLEGGVPGADRRRDRLPLRRHPLDRARRSSEDARGGGRGALRGRDPVPQPAVRDREPGRAPGRRPARGGDDRRDRARRRRRPGRGPAVPAARRQADRPLRLPPRERRRAGPGDDPRGRSASSTTRPRRACRRS